MSYKALQHRVYVSAGLQSTLPSRASPPNQTKNGKWKHVQEYKKHGQRSVGVSLFIQLIIFFSSHKLTMPWMCAMLLTVHLHLCQCYLFNYNIYLITVSIMMNVRGASERGEGASKLAGVFIPPC